jgi:hypothetical protein
VTGVICTGRIVTLTTVFVLFRKEVLERGMSVRILKASHLFEVIFFFFPCSPMVVARKLKGEEDGGESRPWVVITRAWDRNLRS